MKTSIVAYVALFAAIVCFGLVFFLPKLNTNLPSQPIPSVPTPIPVDTGTVSISIDPSEPASVICQWCGQACEPLGTSQYCPDVEPPDSYICQSVENQSQTTCQAVLRSKSSIICDANNICPDGKECNTYIINEVSKNMCVELDDPCQQCPSKKCKVGMELIYPPRITCL